MQIATSAQIRQIEAEAIASGLTDDELMQRAGQAVADRALHRLKFRHDMPPESTPTVTVLVGKGKNGGDGLIAGLRIAQAGPLVRFYLLDRRPDDDPLMQAVRAAGLFVAHAEDDQRYRVLKQTIASAELIIDALYGIGARLPLPSHATRLLDIVRTTLNEEYSQPRYLEDSSSIAIATSDRDPLRRHRRAMPFPAVLAVDCPSGVDVDGGALDSHTLPADETVTFIAPKPGLLMGPAVRAVGRLSVVPLISGERAPTLRSLPAHLVIEEDAARLLPARPVDGNKGTFGKVLILGGSDRYRGAAGLSAGAAYCCGAGLVTVASIRSVVDALSATMLETTWLPLPDQDGQISGEALPLLLKAIPDYDVLVIGPGLGQSDAMRALLLAVLAEVKARALPCVIDADALNLLAGVDRFRDHLPPHAVLTPHPGEMARLTGLSIEAIQADRLNVAARFAREWHVTVLLKGAHSVIANSDDLRVLPFKSSGLAKAGTGDVLAGMIGAYLHTVGTPLNAAVLAGYIHGSMGEDETGALMARNFAYIAPTTLTRLAKRRKHMT